MGFPLPVTLLQSKRGRLWVEMRQLRPGQLNLQLFPEVNTMR